MSTDTQIVSHLDTSDLPMVFHEKAGIQVLRVSLDSGQFTIRNQFKPGFTMPKHRHTGQVQAYTFSGRWRYVEYGIDYTAGTYVYEPAGSVHQIEVPADNTEDTVVMFVVDGAYLEYDDDWNVIGLLDAIEVLKGYEYLCQAQGIPFPKDKILG